MAPGGGRAPDPKRVSAQGSIPGGWGRAAAPGGADGAIPGSSGACPPVGGEETTRQTGGQGAAALRLEGGAREAQGCKLLLAMGFRISLRIAHGANKIGRGMHRPGATNRRKNGRVAWDKGAVQVPCV